MQIMPINYSYSQHRTQHFAHTVFFIYFLSQKNECSTLIQQSPSCMYSLLIIDYPLGVSYLSVITTISTDFSPWATVSLILHQFRSLLTQAKKQNKLYAAPPRASTQGFSPHLHIFRNISLFSSLPLPHTLFTSQPTNR